MTTQWLTDPEKKQGRRIRRAVANLGVLTWGLHWTRWTWKSKKMGYHQSEGANSEWLWKAIGLFAEVLTQHRFCRVFGMVVFHLTNDNASWLVTLVWMWLKQCHKPPIWEWFIEPIQIVMTGRMVQMAASFTHITWPIIRIFVGCSIINAHGYVEEKHGVWCFLSYIVALQVIHQPFCREGHFVPRGNARNARNWGFSPTMKQSLPGWIMMTWS